MRYSACAKSHVPTSRRLSRESSPASPAESPFRSTPCSSSRIVLAERLGRRAATAGGLMTTKANFSDEEWARLVRAPLVASMAISLADPGGPIEAVKESMAAIQTITEAAQSGNRGELIDEVAKSFTEKAQHRKSPLGDFKPR